jgi:C-terminal processing protease CtpA/Prc
MITLFGKLRPGFRDYRKVKWLYIILLVIVTAQNLFCSKKTLPFEPTDEPGISNKWVYDSLKRYYYWSDQLTGKPDYTLPTQEFFEQLLSPEDRFSWISNRRSIGPAGSTPDIFGFYYSLIGHPFDAQQLVGVVTLIIPGGEADKAHLQRSMFFTRVNNTNITTANMSDIISMLSARQPVLLQLATLNNNGTALVDSAQVAIASGSISSKSVYATHVFDKNGTRTGYLAYFECNESLDFQLLDAMQKFKNAGIAELILDLRFNPGGSVASSAKLAAMLIPSFNPDQVYVTFKGNRFGGTVKQTFRQTIAFSASSPGKNMQDLQSRNPGLQRVFILTSGATVSAAEILCNNLKPYMQVIRIGTKTKGKDEASFRIEDKNNPRKVEWVLMPTIYKIFDANDKGGYNSGLLPDHEVNEFSSLPLQPMGFPGDQSVDKALELIYGSTIVGITPLRNKVFPFRDVKEQYQSTGATERGIEVQKLP